MKNQIKKTLFMAALLSFLLSTSANAQIQITGNDVAIANNNESFSTDNFTDFGSVFNTVDAVNAETITREFVIQNSGGTSISALSVTMEDMGGFFEIVGSPSATLASGATTPFTIRFNSHKFGVGIARVIVQSSGESYSFYVRGRNNECNPLICFGIAATDEDVCSGRGSCTGEDLCECNGLSGGTECQIAYTWENGSNELDIPGFAITRIYPGPVLDDPDAVYRVKIFIKTLNNFNPVGFPLTVGLIGYPPPSLTQNLGVWADQYGYRGPTGQKYTGNVISDFGGSYGVGDTVMIEYDAPNQTLSFYVKKAGEDEFAPQGVAFTDITIPEDKVPGIALSLFSNGGSTFEFVE